jgi:hypothetical protein
MPHEDHLIVAPRHDQTVSRFAFWTLVDAMARSW